MSDPEKAHLKPYNKSNKPFSYNPYHQSHRKQYESRPFNYYQSYVNTVRKYFKQQKPKNVKSFVKKLPERYVQNLNDATISSSHES